MSNLLRRGYTSHEGQRKNISVGTKMEEIKFDDSEPELFTSFFKKLDSSRASVVSHSPP